MRHVRLAATAVAATSLVLLASGCKGEYDDSSKGPSGSPSPSASASDKPVDSDLGKTLPAGTWTKVSTDDTDGGTVLRATMVKIEKGSIDDLSEVALTAEERKKQPYYVTMKFENVGKSKMTYPIHSAELRDERGQQTDDLVISGDKVKQCQQPDEGTLYPGSKVTSCRVFMVGKGHTPQKLAYLANFDKQPVYWKAAPKG